MKKQIEIMAPAGSYESLMAAIQGRADSIYFGIEQLNMRAKAANNFTFDDLEKIAEICNSNNVRSYLTLNTIIYDHDLSLMKRIVDKAKAAGITAVIASDQAVINYASSIGFEVHISTQTNVTNLETIKFFSHFADVMVLARELSLMQVKSITDGIKKEKITGPSGNLVEIEIFAHGALCMAVSGKCYLSLHTNNSSANRGACVQNCRRTYEVKDEEGNELLIDNEYIMSPKDLCTIDFLDKVYDAGIKVLKIEGRGRAPEYVAKVIKTYREAIDSLVEGTYNQEKVNHWMSELDKVYNRGFWSGYYLGQKLGEWSDGPGSQATQKKVYIGKGVHYFPKANIGEFKMEAYDLNIGDTVLITGSTTGAQEFQITELFVNDVQSQSATKGDSVTIPLTFRMRPNDKLYKIVENIPE